MIDVHVSFVIDDSSSMRGQENSTVEGFNSFLKEQQENTDGNAWLSLTLFGDRILPRYAAWNVKDIPNMVKSAHGSGYATRSASLTDYTEGNFYAANGSCTMLYDAVGVAIKGAEKWQKSNPWFDGKMLVVIQTDGQENASVEWSGKQIQDLIAYKKGEGWEFLFLGTGEGSWAQGRQMSGVVGQANTINYKGGDHRMAYNSVSTATSSLRGAAMASAAVMDVDQSWNSVKLEDEPDGSAPKPKPKRSRVDSGDKGHLMPRSDAKK